MLGKLVSLPESVIDRRINSRGAIPEGITVLVCGLLGSIGLAYVATEILSGVRDPPSLMNFHLLGEIVGPVAFLFVAWILYTVAAHLLSRFFGGRGPIIRVFRVAAWSLVPLGAWHLLKSIVTIALFADVDVPEEPAGLGAEAQIETIMALGFEDPIYVLTTLSGVLFVAWSWYLFSSGLAAAKNIGEDEARKIAAVPAAVVALYVVVLALGWQGIL